MAIFVQKVSIIRCRPRMVGVDGLAHIPSRMHLEEIWLILGLSVVQRQRIHMLTSGLPMLVPLQYSQTLATSASARRIRALVINSTWPARFILQQELSFR